jgi:predicted RNA binding protein YcfA (HicA-like mRNA interferase family)
VKLPRDLDGRGLARALRSLGYEITRQNGSHMRLTTQEGGEHHITIPNHASLRVGTLAGIVADVAEHFGISRDQLLDQLFG